MAENLNTSKFSDGTPIPNIINKWDWNQLSTPAWCSYGNDSAYSEVFGKLYNGFAIMTKSNGGKNVCPSGWHVSTDAEWLTLVEYLGGSNVAGDKLKEAGDAHWNVPNTDATNSSLFSALPGGTRNSEGDFGSILGGGAWFTITEMTSSNLWNRAMYSWEVRIDRGIGLKKDGLSIRCVKD